MTATRRSDAAFWTLVHLITATGVCAALGATACLIRLLTGA